jgi:hypothetical protein
MGKFTLRELLALEQVRIHYLQATREYKKSLRSNDIGTQIQIARSLNINYGLCHFAYSMNSIKPRIVKNYEDLIRKVLKCMNYDPFAYVYYKIENCETKILAEMAIEYRKKLLKKMIKFVTKKIYEKSKQKKL